MQKQIKTMNNQPTIDDLVNKMKNNDSSFYFYVPNTKGNVSGAVAYIYDVVAALRERGYKAFILHDKEYMTPLWMGGNYSKLPHIAFEKLKLSAIDFLFLPEAWVQSFYSDMRQNNIKLPCEVVVVSQVYDLIFFGLESGTRWSHFGIKNVLTTSKVQKGYIEKFMRGQNVHCVNPYIHDDFKPSEKPTTPKIFLFTRDKSRGEKIEKQFHIQYPQYAWVPFVRVSNMDRSQFADTLKDCCLSVWVDEISSFGTFPLESMKCGVPVIGKIPELMPEWMGTEENGKYHLKDNGIWLLNYLSIPEYIAQYLDEWVTDTLNENVLPKMQETAAQYNEGKFKEELETFVKALIDGRIQTFEAAKK